MRENTWGVSVKGKAVHFHLGTFIDDLTPDEAEYVAGLFLEAAKEARAVPDPN